MQFSTLLAAVATLGLTVVSAAPTGPFFGGPGPVMQWDMFVGRGVAKIQKAYPGAKVVSITGKTFDGQPTTSIMSIQKFDLVFDADGKTVHTANYDDKGEDVPQFTDVKVTGGHMIGNTAFEFNKDNVKLGGFEAQAAFRQQAGADAQFDQITLRNSQHPYGIYYFFHETSSQNNVQIKAN